MKFKTYKFFYTTSY